MLLPPQSFSSQKNNSFPPCVPMFWRGEELYRKKASVLPVLSPLYLVQWLLRHLWELDPLSAGSTVGLLGAWYNFSKLLEAIGSYWKLLELLFDLMYSCFNSTKVVLQKCKSVRDNTDWCFGWEKFAWLRFKVSCKKDGEVTNTRVCIISFCTLLGLELQSCKRKTTIAHYNFWHCRVSFSSFVRRPF